ncbi:MAG: hypothetical protein JSU68_04640 [Phycisphaerales bacterium]|nr:MAG: hypothetical protein JSU68_04640 [Phycisphaerales bacterium]
MRTVQRISGFKKVVVLVMMGSACLFQFGSCNIADMTVSPEVTMSAEDMVTFLVTGLIFDPLELMVKNGISALFDELSGDDE